MHLIHRGSGFSLVEAVVASAVLLLTCVAVGGTLSATLHAESATRQRSALEQVLTSESARLTALPFFRRAAPPAGGTPGDLQPPSLLAVVFPHARPQSNSAMATYCDGSGPGRTGSFVTLDDADGALVRREARFVVGSGTQWDDVLPVALEGWAVWAGCPVPASTVEIALSVSSGGRTVSTDLLLSALRARAAPEASPGAGSPADG